MTFALPAISYPPAIIRLICAPIADCHIYVHTSTISKVVISMWRTHMRRNSLFK